MRRLAVAVSAALVEVSEIETEYPAASLLVLFCNEKSTLRKWKVIFTVILSCTDKKVSKEALDQKLHSLIKLIDIP